uniref:P-type domain-containing protein n=1 Tax=Ciona savignyi TaxID=51511 RepID=H2ZQF2_CIOSA
MLFQYLAVIVCAWSVVSAAPKKSCGISFISRKRCGTGTEDKSACEAMNCCFDTGAISTSTMRCYRSGNTLSLGHPTKKPQIWRNRQQTPRDQTLNLYSLLGNNQIDRNLAIASWISNLDTSGTGYGHLALSSVLGDSYINRSSQCT